MPTSQYDFIEQVVNARSVAGVRARGPRGRIAQEFRYYLDQIYASRALGAIALDGQNIFIYRDGSGDQLSVDFCVGVTAPFTAVGAVVPLETPSGQVAMTTHVGDYGAMGAAHEAVIDWAALTYELQSVPVHIPE